MVRYSKDCISYHELIYEQLLTRKLLNQEFQAVKFKAFLPRHHELVDRYKISVSQMMEMFHFGNRNPVLFPWI